MLPGGEAVVVDVGAVVELMGVECSRQRRRSQRIPGRVIVHDRRRRFRVIVCDAAAVLCVSAQLPHC